MLKNLLEHGMMLNKSVDSNLTDDFEEETDI
jgi:hypothetical protein